MKRITLIGFLFLSSILLHAQWSADTLQRNILTNKPGNQYEPAISSDGNKGAFVSWTDLNYSPARAYIQHINSEGYIQWKVNGISIADTTITGFGPSNTHLVPDTKGGVIVVYTRTAIGGADHIYAQRINQAGIRLWNPPVDIDVSADARLLNATSDEHGGAIINWYKYQGGTQAAVQWIDSSGVAYMPVNGLLVTNNDKVHYDNRVAYAGSPEHMMAYAVYCDYNILRIHAFDTSGKLLFANPVSLDSSFIRNSGGPISGYSIAAIPGTNKAIIAWESQKGTHPDCVRAQSINADESINWNPNGNIIDSAAAGHYPVTLCNDGAKGVYLSYNSYNTLYMQQITGEGKTRFPNGLQNCSTAGTPQLYAEMVPDGKGGVIIGWQDGRGSMGVYAQRYDSVGNTFWRPCGTPVFNAYNVGSANAMKLASCYDGTGIATWLSGIYGTNDVFAGKVDNVSLTGLADAVGSKQDISVYPNPASELLNVYVKGNSGKEMYQVVDIAGHVVISKASFTGERFVIPTQNLRPGVYILLTTNKGIYKRSLFVVK